MASTRPTEETPEERQAFGRALEDLLDGESQTSFAARLSDHLGETVGQSSISHWKLGNHAPPRRYVWAIEQMYGLTHGTLSRLLGYVSSDAVPATDVRSAIDGDLGLTQIQREDLLAQWERMVERTAAQRHQRRRPSAP